MMIALVNIDRLRSFSKRDSQFDMIDQCSTARELCERYPDVFHSMFSWVFLYSEIYHKDKETIKKLFDSESFYSGYVNTIKQNHY